MTTPNPPVQSARTLWITSLTAMILAGLILLTAVLPAEYGFDPTGIGHRLRLTEIADQGDVMLRPIVAACRDEATHWQDTVTIIVPPRKGLEYKFALEKGAKLEYTWQTGGDRLYYDLHGEPKGDKTGYFRSFQERTASQSSGAIVAEFEGPHGWYWENKSRHPIAVILNTKGNYESIGLIH